MFEINVVQPMIMSRLFFAVFDEGGSERPGGQHPQMKLAAPPDWKLSHVARMMGNQPGIESCFMSGEETRWRDKPLFACE